MLSGCLPLHRRAAALLRPALRRTLTACSLGRERNLPCQGGGSLMSCGWLEMTQPHGFRVSSCLQRKQPYQGLHYWPGAPWPRVTAWDGSSWLGQQPCQKRCSWVSQGKPCRVLAGSQWDAQAGSNKPPQHAGNPSAHPCPPCQSVETPDLPCSVLRKGKLPQPRQGAQTWHSPALPTPAGCHCARTSAPSGCQGRCLPARYSLPSRPRLRPRQWTRNTGEKS